MTQEIKNTDWPAFCEQLTRQRAGAVVKLEIIESNGVKTERAANATFEGMVFDKTDACNDVITLRLRSDQEIVYEIVDPIRITLQPSGAPGDFNPLQIAAENGTCILTFHPAIHTQMLGNVKAK
jgi:Family of unknown function (DUF5335)